MGFSESRWAKGVIGENTVESVIENLYDVKRTLEKQHPWDYESETDVVEQKTRFNMKSSTYNEWYFPVNKIINCKNEKRRCHLIYFFPDDNTLWSITYDPSVFAGFQTKFVWAERTDSVLIPAKNWKRISWGPITSCCRETPRPAPPTPYCR